MLLKKIATPFSICQLSEIPENLLKKPYTFFAHTDDELSLVCPTELVPAETIKREDDWLALKIVGILDFSLIGILANITNILAEAEISVFAVSTYNTDYLLVKQNAYPIAAQTLCAHHYKIID